MALTNTTALNSRQVDYLNGEEGGPSPFCGAQQVLNLLFGNHVENLREDILDPVVDSLKLTPGADLTIAAGLLTPTNSYHAADTEAAAVSDNLDNITATDASAGSLLLLKPVSGARTIVIRHNQGSSYSNIFCPGAQNVSLADANDFALFVHNGSVWVLIWANTLVAHEAYVRAALAAATATVGFNTQSVNNIVNATLSGTLNADSHSETTAGAGVSVMKQVRHQHGGARNVETLAAGKVLVAATDPQYHNLDPGGASRTVTLPANEDGLFYWLYNSADVMGELLTVQTSVPATIVTLNAHEGALVINDGTTWALVLKEYVDFGTQGVKADKVDESTTGVGIELAKALLLSHGGAYNSQALAGNLVLAKATSPHFQRLDPNGASRLVTLPAEATSDGLWYIVTNFADVVGELLTVQDDTPTTVLALDAQESAVFVCNGTAWVGLPLGKSDFESLGLKTDVIDESTAGAAISLIKALCLAEGTGVNLETLAGPKVLVITDAQFQVLDPDSAPRVLTLPAAKTGLFYWVFNFGGTLGETINVQKADTTSLRILDAGECGLFVCAADWVFTGIARVDFGANGIKADKIDESTAGAGVSVMKQLRNQHGGARNVETLAAGKTLVAATDPQFQNLDPGGASRTVTLPANEDGLWYWIYNSADLIDELLTVQTAAPVTVVVLNSHEGALVVNDGSSWAIAFKGYTDFGTIGLRTDYIRESTTGRSIGAINAFRFENGGAYNVETLAAGKVLTVADAHFQRYDPDGVNRTVTLPAESSLTDGMWFCISNEANALGELITVQDDTPTSIYTLDPREMAWFVCNGTNWVFVGRSLCDFGALGLETDRLSESTAGAAISAQQALCLAEGGGANQEVLAGTKTLVVTDAHFQRLDPDGVNRNVVLPTLKEGLWYQITNYGGALGETLTVQNPTPATVRILNAGETGTFVSTAAAWFFLGGGLVDFGAPGLKTDSVDESTAGAAISLIKALRLQGGGAYNVETLAAGKVLTIADAHFQRLDPDGVNRTVTLPAEATSDGLWYVIANEANSLGELITVQDDTPASIYALDPREMAIFVCNGTNWVFAGRSLCDFGALGLETDKLSESTSGAGISAQHALCIAEGGGVNQEVLAGTKTLVVTDAQFQRLDPDGVNRNVVLPALKAGLWYRISNYGGTLGETLTVQNPTPATVRVLEAGESGFFVSTGAAWLYLGGGLVDFGAPGIKTDSIDESTAGAAISLVKALCMAEGGGVNAETLAAGKTLVVTDAQFQALDPDGTPRIVTLPAVKAGLLYVVFNTGGALGETLDVQNPAAASLRILDAGEFAIFASTGAAWSWMGSGRVDFGANGLKTDVLEESTGGAAISAMKALRLREGNGINVETLAGAKVLVNTDAQFQKLDPDGVSRDVTLPAIQEGLFYWIYDVGGALGETLVVKNPAAATLATLDAGQVGLFVCGAAAWVYAGPTLATDFAAVAAALAAASAAIDVNAQSIQDANVVQLNTFNEATAGNGINLTSGVEIIGVPLTISTPIAYNTVSGNLFAKPAGETWLIHSVWFKTAVDWDGDGAFIVGDGTDADGFLVMANASLDPAYDETAGLAGWPPGTRGLRNSNEGVYLTNAGVPQSFISLPGGNIVFANTPGTSSAGNGTLYMQYTRLP